MKIFFTKRKNPIRNIYYGGVKIKNTIIHLLIFHSFTKVILHCIFIHVYGRSTGDTWGPLNHHPSLHLHLHSTSISTLLLSAPSRILIQQKEHSPYLTTKQRTIRKWRGHLATLWGRPAPSLGQPTYCFPLYKSHSLLLSGSNTTQGNHLSSKFQKQNL